MALNPCIENGDCIDLSIQPNSNLRADLNLSEDAGNCADCRPNGLYVPCGVTLSPNACNGLLDVGNGIWTPTVGQTLATQVIPEVIIPGPIFGPTGKIVVRTIQLTFTPPVCGSGVVIAAMNAGPLQFSDVSPLGRVTGGQQARTLPNPFAGGPYGLIKNPGGNFMDIAFPVMDSTTTIDPTPPGVPMTVEWEQSYEVFAGSVGSIIFRTVFFYIWTMFS